MSDDQTTISQADIAETMSKTFERHGLVKKGMLPDANQWGVDVLYSKSNAGLMMFHWITPDLLEINLEFDMFELKKQGKVYIESRYELINMQLAAAREERQRDQSIIIHNSTPPKPKPLNQAISTAVAGNETVH